MGNSEKTLLRVLNGLTNGRTSCEVVPEDLRTRLFSGPVEVGQEPKTVSASGLLRQLRNLAGAGQITTAGGHPITFSSRGTRRPIEIRVHRSATRRRAL